MYIHLLEHGESTVNTLVLTVLTVFVLFDSDVEIQKIGYVGFVVKTEPCEVRWPGRGGSHYERPIAREILAITFQNRFVGNNTQIGHNVFEVFDVGGKDLLVA